MSYITVATDYSPVPGGRYIKDGPYSGEEFRQKTVEPALRQCIAQGVKLTVALDGTSGYATSFLEETFGGLVRSLNRSVREHLEIVTDNPVRLREVESYIADEEKKLRR